MKGKLLDTKSLNELDIQSYSSCMNDGIIHINTDRILNHVGCINNYAKYLYDETNKSQENDELQGLIHISCNNILTELEMDDYQTDYGFELNPLKTAFVTSKKDRMKRTRDLENRLFEGVMPGRFRSFMEHIEKKECIEWHKQFEGWEWVKSIIKDILMQKRKQEKIINNYKKDPYSKELSEKVDRLQQFVDFPRDINALNDMICAYSSNLKIKDENDTILHNDKHAKKNYVYFICDEHVNTIKIGISNNPKRRLRDFQNNSPFNLKLILAFRGDTVIEKLIQRFFHKFRMRGEWFEYDDDIGQLISFIKEWNHD